MADIAGNYGATGGKWISYPDGRNVLNEWYSVARAVVSGEFGDACVAAKVSTVDIEKQNRKHVVTTYNKNYTDVSEVMQIEEKLRALGLNERMNYKASLNSYSTYKNNNNLTN